MTGILYYDASRGAFVYKEGNDDKDKLYFCDIDCAEGFCRLNNLEDKK